MRTRIRYTGRLWPSNFFLNFLDRAEPEEIRNYLGTLKEQTRLIKKRVFEIVIFTEGSVRLEDAWNLDNEDQEILIETFEEYVNAKNPKGKGTIKQEQM